MGTDFVKFCKNFYENQIISCFFYIVKGSAIGSGVYNSQIITPEYPISEMNFYCAGGGLFGTINFQDSNKFNLTVNYDTGGWSGSYKVYKIMGIKFE